jgi:hypothetical protein
MRHLFLAASLLAATATMPALAGEQDFKLVNRTGYQINEVYVSRSSSRNWGHDMMGSDNLGDRESVDLTFNAPDNACHWDMKVKYDDGDTAEWSDLNLCKIDKVTLYYDRKAGTTRAVTE